jgi:hypothetical protein
MKTNATRETNHTQPLADMAETALRNYEQAMRTGLKFQEEAGKMWTSMFNQAACTPDWQKQVTGMTGMASSLLPLAQRRMEEVMNLMEKNGKAGAELIKKAVDAAQTPTVAESQAKWMEFWTSSMGAVRSNAEAVSQISSKAIDSWIDIVRKSSELCEARPARAA